MAVVAVSPTIRDDCGSNFHVSLQQGCRQWQRSNAVSPEPPRQGPGDQPASMACILKLWQLARRGPSEGHHIGGLNWGNQALQRGGLNQEAFTAFAS